MLSRKLLEFTPLVTGKPAFIAPRGRSFEEFAKESKAHGWPSFRDSEVVWDNVRAGRPNTRSLNVCSLDVCLYCRPLNLCSYCRSLCVCSQCRSLRECS
jgi:hypothetical protein